MSKLRLGVNIDHVATLRQARGTSYPDPVDAASIALAHGADSITVHLREDRRHIQEHDLTRLLEMGAPVNLELAVTDEMLRIALGCAPRDVCLVPERRQELTTEGGLDVHAQSEAVTAAVGELIAAEINVSVFIDPDPIQLDACARAGARVVELHTGRYADAAGAARATELARLVDAALHASQLGLQVHAGHGLHYSNTQAVARIAQVVELNIGHAIVARALTSGIAAAVREMRELMDGARG
jgi:pyridoxine 5-phosphate synthase